MVNYYGPSDFTKSYGKSVDAAQVLPLWLGGDLKSARRKHIHSSPLNWVTPSAAPALCIHGTEDKYVAHEQAVWMIDRIPAGQANDRLRRVALAVLNEFVSGWFPKGMADASVQIRKRTEYVIPRQTWRNRLGHDEILLTPSLPDHQ